MLYVDFKALNQLPYSHAFTCPIRLVCLFLATRMHTHSLSPFGHLAWGLLCCVFVQLTGASRRRGHSKRSWGRCSVGQADRVVAYTCPQQKLGEAEI